MNKILLLGLVLLLTLGLAFGSDVPILGEDYTLWADITKEGFFFPATNATITLINPNNTIIVNDEQMINYSAGIFTYVYSFNQVGEWFGYVQFYNDTTVVAIASQSLIVRESSGKMIEEKYIFLIVVAMLTFLAFYLKNYAILIGTGIFFMIVPFVFNFNWNILGGSFQYLMFMLIGLAILYQGISELLHERKKR